MESPRYATLLYKVLDQLDISIAEYFYLDMIHKLSYQRWCIKSLERCAEDMHISKRGLIKLRDRLLERELLEKNDKGYLRVTTKYTEAAVNKVHQTENETVNKVPKSVNLVHPIGEQSSPKNNNRITKKTLTESMRKAHGNPEINGLIKRFEKEKGKRLNNIVEQKRAAAALLRLRDVTYKDIVKVIDWYFKQKHDEFTIKVSDLVDLQKKWNRLVDLLPNPKNMTYAERLIAGLE